MKGLLMTNDLETMLNHEKNLQDVYFKLIHVRDLIKEEIKIIKPEVENLSQATRLFVAHFDDFQKMSEDAQDTLKQSITSAANTLGKQASDHIERSINSKIENTLTQLQTKASQVRETLERAKIEFVWRHAITLVICFLMSIVAGIGSGYYFASKFSHITSPLALKTFEYGDRIIRIWYKLTPQEREKILKLSSS